MVSVLAVILCLAWVGWVNTVKVTSIIRTQPDPASISAYATGFGLLKAVLVVAPVIGLKVLWKRIWKANPS